MKKRWLLLGLILTVFALYSVAWAEETPTTGSGDEVEQAIQKLMDAFTAQDVTQIEALIPEVLPVMETAAQANSTDDNLYFALHLCYMFTEDEVQGLKSIEKAHTLAPENHFYTFYYALALKMNWEPLAARELLAQVSEALDHPVEIDLYVTTVDVAIQQYDSAEAFYTSILDLLEGENRSIVLSDLGLIKLHQGQHANAIELLKESIELVPQNIVAQTRLGEALIKSGQVEEGLAALESALFVNQDYMEAMYYKGVALELLQKSAEARTAYDAAYHFGLESLSISNDDGREHFILGQICKKLGLEEESAQHLADAQTLLYQYEAPFSEVSKP